MAHDGNEIRTVDHCLLPFRDNAMLRGWFQVQVFFYERYLSRFRVQLDMKEYIEQKKKKIFRKRQYRHFRRWGTSLKTPRAEPSTLYGLYKLHNLKFLVFGLSVSLLTELYILVRGFLLNDDAWKWYSVRYVRGAESTQAARYHFFVVARIQNEYRLRLHSARARGGRGGISFFIR